MVRKTTVCYSRFSEKQIRRLPKNILESLQIWKDTIELAGIQAMRKIPGYHDEPLKWQRVGQRSSRLNRSYRVIYVESKSGEVLIINVLEVNKHDY